MDFTLLVCRMACAACQQLPGLELVCKGCLGLASLSCGEKAEESSQAARSPDNQVGWKRPETSAQGTGVEVDV